MNNINNTPNHSSFSPAFHSIKSGRFMSRPIQWICHPDKYTVLRKVAAIFAAVLLTLSILGVFIVIQGAREYHRQINVTDGDLGIKNGKNNLSPSKPRVDSISKTLAKFNNSSVRGQVNGIYITTNESNLVTTSQLLDQQPPLEHHIHIGCATWHNFDIMYRRKSEYGLIIDFNPKNAEFIRKTVEIIKSSESRQIFKSAMIDHLNSLEVDEKKLFFHSDQKGLPTERVEEELSREGSWLQSDESYDFIKNIALDGRLIAITENITNHKRFSKIRKFLDSKNIVIDTVYLSNVCNFMKTKQEKEKFTRSIRHLVNSKTVFISCPTIKRENEIKILNQKPVLGSEILKEDYDTTLLFEERA